MKILHVTPWYEPAWGAGGTAVAASRLCRGLVNRGHDVTVFTTTDDGEGGTIDQPTGAPTTRGGVTVEYYTPDFWFPPKRSFSASGLIDHLPDAIPEFDLVHVASTRHKFEQTVRQHCRTHDVPYVVTPHASLMEWWMGNIGRSTLKRLYMWRNGRAVLRDASAIHFLSETERERSARYTEGVPSFVVPNGIEVEEFATPEIDGRERRIHYGLPANATVLLHLGRIHPQKNVHLTIEGVADLVDRGQAVHFAVIGPIADAEYHRELLALIDEHDLHRYVQIHPPVPEDRLKEAYEIADVLVLPSKVEGISMTLIEAMARSTPVIVSDRVGNAPAIREWDAGEVVEASSGAVADAVARLEPERIETLSAKAWEMARNVYDVSAVAERMERAYENVLSGERDPDLQWQGGNS